MRSRRRSCRSTAGLRRWSRAGAPRASHGEIARTTGCAPDAASQTAQLAWLAAHRPAVLDQAASVLCGKDWLYFCLTGERASESSAALAAFGNLETGAYDAGLLEQLGLQDFARLLPAIIDGTRHQGALAPAAAAATGLPAGMPVVLGPVDAVARGAAAGLAAEAALGASDPAPGGLHVRAGRELPWRDWPERGIAIRRFAGRWFALAAQPATLGPDWLIGLAEQLLADAGLIGVPRRELIALLEHNAAAAPGGAVLRRQRRWRRLDPERPVRRDHLLRPSAGDPRGARLRGSELSRRARPPPARGPADRRARARRRACRPPSAPPSARGCGRCCGLRRRRQALR